MRDELDGKLYAPENNRRHTHSAHAEFCNLALRKVLLCLHVLSNSILLDKTQVPDKNATQDTARQNVGVSQNRVIVHTGNHL